MPESLSLPITDSSVPSGELIVIQRVAGGGLTEGRRSLFSKASDAARADSVAGGKNMLISVDVPCQLRYVGSPTVS